MGIKFFINIDRIYKEDQIMVVTNSGCLQRFQLCNENS